MRIALLASVLVSVCFGCAGADPDPVVPDENAIAASASASSAPEPVASPSATPSAAPEPSVAATATASATAAPPPGPLPAGLKILVIGDSFGEALGAGLKTREASSNIKVFLRAEKATFIPEWAGPKRGVAGMMVSLKPDVVVIALGGNELAMTTPDIRGPKVKALVELIGKTPCVWVSPPLWGNNDNGLLGVIRSQSGPCRYFDSSIHSPDLPRGGDKIHPTAEGQKKWADYVLTWLTKEKVEGAAPFSLKPRPQGE